MPLGREWETVSGVRIIAQWLWCISTNGKAELGSHTGALCTWRSFNKRWEMKAKILDVKQFDIHTIPDIFKEFVEDVSNGKSWHRLHLVFNQTDKHCWNCFFLMNFLYMCIEDPRLLSIASCWTWAVMLGGCNHDGLWLCWKHCKAFFGKFGNYFPKWISQCWSLLSSFLLQSPHTG